MNARPLLVFDGDCGFCRYWITRWRNRWGESVEVAPYQEAAERFPEIPREAFAKAVHLIEPDGTVSRGAEAVFRSLRSAPGCAWLYAAYRAIPAMRYVSEGSYRWIARHRRFAFRATRLLWGKHPPGEGDGAHFLGVSVFLRALAAIFAVAFLSLWIQIDGLVGAQGILPAGEWLKLVASRVGMERFVLAPTLAWLWPSDVMLHLLCAGGILFSGLLFAGVAPAISVVVLTLLYLSLCTVCRVFLSFQWDALLVETGFMAALVAPLARNASSSPPRRPAWSGLLLLRVLLFKLIFTSGVVKLSSGDPTWRDLTALTYHYQTQPLPNGISWLFQQLPAAFHRASAAVMFAVELGAPFLLLGPRRLRHIGLAAIVGLQLLILATGNYGFFNLLALALCLPFLDDAAWPARLRRRFPPYRSARDGGREHAAGPAGTRGSGWPRAVAVPLAVVLLLMNGLRISASFRRPIPWPTGILRLAEATDPFRVVNGYGLFAVMTTERLEIILEGSDDGAAWKPYEFRFKPGRLDRIPPYVVPHMPRLDWQMWFAALGTPAQNPWFGAFCTALLEGRPDVLHLLAHDPFPDRPPKYLRAQLYEYRFTTWAERKAGSGTWKREGRDAYLPVISIESFRRRPN